MKFVVTHPFIFNFTDKPLQILTWNQTTQYFEKLDAFNQQGAISAFSIDDDLHMIFSDSSVYMMNQENEIYPSPVNKIEESSELMYEFHFSNRWYIAAGVLDNSNMSSRGAVKLYRFDDSTGFELIQSLSTDGLSSITSFNLGNSSFLVIANDRDWSGEYSTYQVAVDIYRRTSLSGGIYQFFQRIPTYRAVHVAVTTFGSQTLLAITHYEQSVSVYRYALDLGFLLLEEIRVPHCQSAVFSEKDDETYLIVTTDSFVDSTKIFNLKPIGKEIHGSF